MNKKWILGILLAGLIAMLAACGSDDNNANENNDGNNESESAEGQADMPEPDLEGVPDEVAEVNGETIPKKEFEDIYKGVFQQAMMQAQMSGQELNQDDLKKQVADSLIGQKLILQEAKEKDFKASDEEKDDILSDVMEQQGLDSKEDLYDTLEEQDIKKDEFMKEVEDEVIVNKLVAEEAGDMEPSEDEVKDFYAKYKEQQEQADSDEEVKSLDDLKPQIVDRLKQNKEVEVKQDLMKDLREDADVKNNLS